MAVLDFSGKMLERDANKDRRAGLRGARDLFSTSKLYNQLGAYGMAGLGFLANVNPITAAIMAAGGGYLGSKYAESGHEQPDIKFAQGEIQSELDRAEESKYANTLQNTMSVAMAAYGMKEKGIGFTGDFSASPLSKVMGDIGTKAKTLGQNIGTTAQNISDRAYALRHGVTSKGQITKAGLGRFGIPVEEAAKYGFKPENIISTEELLKSHAGDAWVNWHTSKPMQMSHALGEKATGWIPQALGGPEGKLGTALYMPFQHPLLAGLLGYGMYRGYDALANKGEE